MVRLLWKPGVFATLQTAHNWEELDPVLAASSIDFDASAGLVLTCAFAVQPHVRHLESGVDRPMNVLADTVAGDEYLAGSGRLQTARILMLDPFGGVFPFENYYAVYG